MCIGVGGFGLDSDRAVVVGCIMLHEYHAGSSVDMWPCHSLFAC